MFGLFKKSKEKKETIIETERPEMYAMPEDPDSENAAAISIALNLYLQQIHDYEKMILTIQKVVRPYSPWSSKIYGLRQYPRR